MSEPLKVILAESTNLNSLLIKNQYDFIDFGCGVGGSMTLAKTLFNGNKGLGLDISEEKVSNANKLGYDAECVDILKLPLMSKYCNFVMVSHFLEHLESVKDARIMIRNAIALARDFVYIQQPYFDADGLLFKDGYKLYWSDWHGHPNHMTSLEFHCILNKFLNDKIINRFIIFVDKPIRHPINPAVHPLESPINQNVYNSEIHPLKKKRLRPFNYPVYHEIKVLIDVSLGDKIEELMSKIKYNDILFDSQKS